MLRRRLTLKKNRPSFASFIDNVQHDAYMECILKNVKLSKVKLSADTLEMINQAANFNEKKENNWLNVADLAKNQGILQLALTLPTDCLHVNVRNLCTLSIKRLKSEYTRMTCTLQ
jgi:hypothetical protein